MRGGGLGDRNGSIYGRVSGRRGIVRDDGYGRLCRGDNRLDLGNRLGTGAGMSLAASDISDSDGSGVAGVAGVPGTPECCAVGTASTSS